MKKLTTEELENRMINLDNESFLNKSRIRTLSKKVIENEKDILFIHQLIKVLFLENIAIVILLIIWSW